MNKLPMAKRVAVVAALVEGNSIRATSRMTDVSKPTILKLLADLGEACAEYHDRAVRNVKASRIQADEIWSFVGSKEKSTSPERKAEGWGDLWTWTAMDADSKLMLSYAVGPRSPRMAFTLMNDLASRVSGRVQITTDGLYWYQHAVEQAFGIDADYATQQKHYAGEAGGRYSPGRFVKRDHGGT